MERQVRSAVTAERKGVELVEILGHLLQERVPETQQNPLGAIEFVATRTIAVEGEGAVWEGTVVGGRYRVAVKAVLNFGVSATGPMQSSAHHEIDVLNALQGSTPNVCRPLLRFVCRPTAEMIRLVVEGGFLTQRHVDENLTDTRRRPRPMHMLVMPLFRGASLEAWVRGCLTAGRGRLDYLHAIGLLRGVADGLCELRRQGVAHMDMKLKNCLVDVDTGVGPCEWSGGPAGSDRTRLPRAVVSDLGTSRCVPRRAGGEGGEMAEEGVVWEAALEEARRKGREEAAVVDRRFVWEAYRGPERGGTPQSRAPEVLRARGGEWDLRRQSPSSWGWWCSWC
jgi:serine/threonine protein kinase